jgi:diguanylate cyclase
MAGDRRLLEVLKEAALPDFLLVLVLLVALRHEWRWKASIKAMSSLLAEIRAGEAGSEDLAALGEQSQELAQLAERVATLCRDLKAHKQAVAALEAEIARRVATRTDSLERKLGALREEASRDALTGVGNRGAFDSVFATLFEQAQSEQADLCVIMIDVDHFKHLNDTLGHWAGDVYLRNVGELIRAAVRERDHAFRYGGDEFVLVLWNTSAAAGRATATRLCRLSEQLSQSYRLVNRPRLSCGVASLTETGASTAEELLRRADEDLYRLKHARKAYRLAA